MRKRFSVFYLLLSWLLLISAGCGKKDAPVVANPPVDTNATANTAPGPNPTPVAPQTLVSPDNMDAVLAQLTRQLHRTMIGRKLSGNFDEFVALSHVEVPPPPAGKKYAIDKHWHVVLVHN